MKTGCVLSTNLGSISHCTLTWKLILLNNTFSLSLGYLKLFIYLFWSQVFYFPIRLNKRNLKSKKTRTNFENSSLKTKKNPKHELILTNVGSFLNFYKFGPLTFDWKLKAFTKDKKNAQKKEEKSSLSHPKPMLYYARR